MSFPLACALCAALLAVDLLARSLRLHWLLRGAGYRLPVPSLSASILFGDAAAAVTPMRLGGEPARWLGLLSAGVPAGAAVADLELQGTEARIRMAAPHDRGLGYCDRLF